MGVRERCKRNACFCALMLVETGSHGMDEIALTRRGWSRRLCVARYGGRRIGLCAAATFLCRFERRGRDPSPVDGASVWCSMLVNESRVLNSTCAEKQSVRLKMADDGTCVARGRGAHTCGEVHLETHPPRLRWSARDGARGPCKRRIFI